MFPRVAFLSILTERCPFTVVWEMFESWWRRFQVESEEHEGESRLYTEHLATRGGLTVKKGSDCHHGRGFASRIGWENRSDPFSRFFESLAALLAADILWRKAMSQGETTRRTRTVSQPYPSSRGGETRGDALELSVCVSLRNGGSAPKMHLA